MRNLPEKDDTLTCPFCHYDLPRSQYQWYATPPGKYVMPYKCPKCKKIFAPMAEVK